MSIVKMIFGDDKTIFKKFDVDEWFPEHKKTLVDNNGKVALTEIGFASEWEGWVDFDESYAYIDDGKLYVMVYGMPEHINEKSVKAYYNKTIEQYIEDGFGEFFEVAPGCPICMIVERDGVDHIV